MAIKRLKPQTQDRVDALVELLKTKGVLTTAEAKDVKEKKAKAK